MLPSIPSWGLVFLAAFPALLKWWWGRPLARRADDPVLPERLLAHNKRCGLVTGIAIGLAIIAGGPYGAWAIPCVYVTNAAAGFPLRRTLYEETWGFGAFLSFFGRLWLGFLGFWALMLATPSLASMGGRRYWTVSLALGATLEIWNFLSPVMVRRLLRVRPIEDAGLLARFDAIVARSTAARPRFEYVPMRGGMLVNALALPAFRQSSVIFTDTLLSRFTQDEVVAICAHEIAHLEYYDPPRLRRIFAFTSLLTVIAVLIAPVTAVFGLGGWVSALWIAALVIGLALHMRRRQKNETASDVRAVELTGDPEALARALTKLHQIARVPRRWAQQHEERATHPSLARRIRDIRASAGTAPAALETSTAFRAADGSATITFHPAVLDWQDASGTQSLDYARLTDLRLNATAGGTVTLVAIDIGGRRREMTPSMEDVHGLQAVLDIVDGRVDGRLPHERVARPFSPFVTRLVAALAVGLSWIVSQGAFALAAALAVLVPAPALLFAAGVAGIAAAALLLVNDSAPGVPFIAGLSIALAICLFALGWVRRRERPRGTTAVVGLLACASLVALVAIAATGVSLVRLHQGARDEPAAFVLLAALAAAAWTHARSRAWRYAAGAAALASIATFAAGTPFFLSHVARDPFQLAGPPASSSPVTEKAAWEFRVPFPVETLRVSPHGRLAAVVRSEDDDDAARNAHAPRAFQIVAPGRSTRPLDADDLVFTSDERALVLRARSGAAEVSEIDLDSNAPIWRQDLGDVRSGSLLYCDATRTWTVDGREAGRRRVRITGTAGGSDIVRHHGPADTRGSSWVEAWAAGAHGILTLDRRLIAGPIHSKRPPPFLYGRPFLWLVRTRSSFTLTPPPSSAARPPVESSLDASCVDDALEDGRFVCAAFDGDRTHVLGFDPDTGSIAPLTTIDGHLWLESASEAGWIEGTWDGTPAVLRIATRELIFAAADDEAMAIAANESVMATAGYGDRASLLRVYRRKSIAP